MDVFLVVPDFNCYLDADFVRNINTGMLAIRQQAVAPPLDVERSIRQVKRLVGNLYLIARSWAADWLARNGHSQASRTNAGCCISTISQIDASAFMRSEIQIFASALLRNAQEALSLDQA